jgi:monoamine oxidase
MPVDIVVSTVSVKMMKHESASHEALVEVLVIGAGAAGIAAARTLHDAGVAVTVVEARPRLGGRVLTDHSLAAHPVELGAEFIHGKRALTWRYVDQFGFTALPDANHGFCFLDGHLYHDQQAPLPGCEELLSLLKARAREHLAAHGPDISVAQFLAGQKDYPLHPSFAATARLLSNLIASEKGADADTMSLSGLLEHDFSGYGDNNFRLGEGYAALLERLASGLDIRPRHPVRRVAWGPDGARISCPGQSFAARHVVVTLPLGTLQKGDVVFSPALPEAKLRAIAGLGSAAVCKMILQFRQAFWSDHLAVLTTTGETQVWWPSGWGRSDAGPVLTALVGGEAARRFTSLGDTALPEALRQLEVMFGRDLRDLYVGGRIVRWHRQRYSRMGYSFLPVGCPAALRDWLAEPLPPTLFFAGEATNRLQPSTVHGALESGVRAARQVLEARERVGTVHPAGVRSHGGHAPTRPPAPPR